MEFDANFLVNFNHIFSRLPGRDAGTRNYDNPRGVEDYLWAFRFKAMPDSPRSEYWADNAACRMSDPHLFDQRASIEATERALRICENCPVRADCLQVALDDKNIEGVWGGTTHFQRLTYLRTGRVVSHLSAADRSTNRKGA